jgi:hypothetical protein
VFICAELVSAVDSYSSKNPVNAATVQVEFWYGQFPVTYRDLDIEHASSC